MINYDTVLSTFDDKLTLLQWLQKVEQALEGAGLERVDITQITPTTAVFKFTFADGTSVTTPSITLPRGPKGDTGATGATGATGNGIASITKTGTAGLVDTYTILYTNGNTITFTVTNGAEGVGISNITLNSSGHLIITLTDTTTIDVGAMPTNEHTIYLTASSGTLTTEEYQKIQNVDGIISLSIGTTQQVYKFQTQDVDYIYYGLLTPISNQRLRITKATRYYEFDTDYLAPYGDQIKSSSAGGIIATSGKVLTADGSGNSSWEDAGGGKDLYMHNVHLTSGAGMKILLTFVSDRASAYNKSAIETYISNNASSTSSYLNCTGYGYDTVNAKWLHFYGCYISSGTFYIMYLDETNAVQTANYGGISNYTVADKFIAI